MMKTWCRRLLIHHKFVASPGYNAGSVTSCPRPHPLISAPSSSSVELLGFLVCARLVVSIYQLVTGRVGSVTGPGPMDTQLGRRLTVGLDSSSGHCGLSTEPGQTDQTEVLGSDSDLPHVSSWRQRGAEVSRQRAWRSCCLLRCFLAPFSLRLCLPVFVLFRFSLH